MILNKMKSKKFFKKNLNIYYKIFILICSDYKFSGNISITDDTDLI